MLISTSVGGSYAGRKGMLSAKEFADRAGRLYQTVMYWLRQGLVPGVEAAQESRGAGVLCAAGCAGSVQG
jgi:hypothetical protein